MIDWPSTLIKEIADRRCIIFLGSGASAGSVSAVDPTKHPPTWRNLLTTAKDRFLRDADDRDAVTDLLNNNHFLDAAQVIHDRSNRADLYDFFRDEFDRPNYQPNDIHRLVLELDPKTVITTNYDRIFDNLCNPGFNVCIYYQDHALNDIRSTTRVILKAHGCISDPTRIVLTRAQYFEMRLKHPAFYRLLDALFLTNTLLFIGCSMTDPDIQLVLENANIAVPCVNRHYAVVEETGRHRSITDAIRTTYNLALLEYPAGQHQEVADSLRELVGEVQAYRSTHP